MLEIPVVRWGQEYQSLDSAEITHFASGQTIARIGLAGGGLVQRDMRSAQKARDLLRQFSGDELIEMLGRAADLFESGTLVIGGHHQTPEDFVRQQSASTGLPENLCRANVKKNSFVLRNMREILDCLTRGLSSEILARGYGMESRGVLVSYQAQSPVLGVVLPNNSPGVHALWLPVVALQLGLVLKPGSAEPWTAYRVAAAFGQAGIPKECISMYPGGHDVGQAILSHCRRSMIFGSQSTVQQYAGNRGVQVHGPGFSKILLGDDCVDRWEEHLDLMVESVISNGGRSCINCSSIWASRHSVEIAEAIAERIGPIEPLQPDNPRAALAAFTTPGAGAAVMAMIEQDLKEAGTRDVTQPFGSRLVEHERYSYLRPMVIHADSSHRQIVSKEFMFPFVTVVNCPQAEMIKVIGTTLVATAITEDATWIGQLTDATNIDRLNIGPIPTNRLNWLQPHEGNLIEFLFRSRAYQMSVDHLAATAN